jgi:nucleoside-diphosphate-sugar epimerase
MKPKILITGASGFIGSFIVEEALKRGFDTWAAVRKSSSKAFLQDERIHFIELNLSSEEQLKEQLRDHQFDYVVHAAGVTKCLHQEDFYRINTEGTQHLVRALLALKMPLKRFVYISSLSIMGAIREQQPYTEIRESDEAKPNTAYGKSKLEAEEWLSTVNHPFPYVILRPTGVYGPRERDYFMMAKSIQAHIDFAVGYQQQDITFVYVTDVVQAVFLALEKGQTGRKYFLSDGESYDSRAFSDLLQQELGTRYVLHIKAPLWFLHIVCAVSGTVNRWLGKLTTLNMDKYHILAQRNWNCDIEPARRELGYEPHWNLERGVKATVKWYIKEKWL